VLLVERDGAGVAAMGGTARGSNRAAAHGRLEHRAHTIRTESCKSEQPMSRPAPVAPAAMAATPLASVAARRLLLVGLLSVAVLAAWGTPTALAAKAPPPRWLAAAERQTLQRVFGGAHPVETYLIGYPNKIAVVWAFDRVVICGACSAPSNALLPHGRVIRLSFDRGTHAVRAADGIRFCDARGSYPPRAACLRR
jgi:hypothetical protein